MNLLRISLVAVALGACPPVLAADPVAPDTAKTQYDAERARCLTASTGQDQASCLKSAGAAYDAIRNGRLNNPDTAYRENALRRCNDLPAADKADCISRVDGGGTRSGSVRGGGDITETVTTSPAPVPDPK